MGKATDSIFFPSLSPSERAHALTHLNYRIASGVWCNPPLAEKDGESII